MAEQEYNMYRGLQKPLVMFGLKGANIGIAAVTLTTVMLCILAGSSMSSIFLGLGLAIVPALIGASKLSRNFREGLHRKKKYPGVWVVKHIIKETK